MQNQLTSIPQFWQGVLGSVLAAIIIGVAVKLYQMHAAQSRRDRKNYEKHMATLKSKLASSEPLLRIEGYLVALFSLMGYLFFGNLCWMLAFVVGPFLRPVDWPLVLILDVLGLVFFAGGLYWIDFAIKIRKAAKSSTLS